MKEIPRENVSSQKWCPVVVKPQMDAFPLSTFVHIPILGIASSVSYDLLISQSQQVAIVDPSRFPSKTLLLVTSLTIANIA